MKIKMGKLNLALTAILVVVVGLLFYRTEKLNEKLLIEVSRNQLYILEHKEHLGKFEERVFYRPSKWLIHNP